MVKVGPRRIYPTKYVHITAYTYHFYDKWNGVKFNNDHKVSIFACPREFYEYIVYDFSPGI